MHTLSLNFKILSFCGMWRPLMWTTGFKLVLYNCYTFTMIFIVCTFAISECVELVVSFENMEEFAHGSFMLLTMIGVCGKTINLVKNRGKIIDLTNVLRNDICKPRNIVEMKIQSDCERDARSNASWYITLVLSTASLIHLRSLIFDIPGRNLLFKGWFPYYYHEKSEFGFWFAYIHQFIAGATAAVVNSSFDTLIPGLMMQICAQMKILKSRVEAIPRIIEERRRESFFNESNADCDREKEFLESELLTKCIRQHNEIFRLASDLNDIFGLVVFLQFAVSTLVLCVSVYEVSKMKIYSSEFTAIFMYLVCMLTQIFVYCFYGGELSNQSVDICESVYKTDWLGLSIRTKRNLTMMMLRSQRPITFICAHIIALSVDSFIRLIKLSYSAYNVLSNDR